MSIDAVKHTNGTLHVIFESNLKCASMAVLQMPRKAESIIRRPKSQCKSACWSTLHCPASSFCAHKFLLPHPVSVAAQSTNTASNFESCMLQ